MNDDPQTETTEAELLPATTEQRPSTEALETTKQAVTNAMTSQQARVQEVTDALAPAYLKASMLELSDAEIETLQEMFPDSAVEIRPHDGLIWIPHIHISNRLNKVFRPGKWATICRRHWLEGTTMYGEFVLVVRGCFVGESIGGHPYQPNNPKTNFSDALESTRAEALRRICGKTLGCGAQVWDPSYSRDWVQKYASQQGGKWHKRLSPQEPSHPLAAPTQQQPGTPAPNRAAAGPSSPTRSRTTARQAPTPPRAQSAPAQACPKCRGTATKKSPDWEGVAFCQRCGWQWDLKTGQYFEGHDWLRVFCTMPPKGVPMAEYKTNPQTLGQISRIDNKRWYGIVMNNTEAEQRKGWTSPKTGKFYPATESAVAFGRACEEAANYLEEQRRLKEGGKGPEQPTLQEEQNDDYGEVPF